MTDRFVYDCALRWSDLDAYGHVNNARFLTLYEEARVAMMFAGGRAWGVGSFADGVVATAEAAPTVRIELWVEEIRAASFTIAYELYDRDVLASRARSVLVPFDLAAQRPRRISADERAFLLRYAPGLHG
ncbi:thioesterase family protein [Micromonospora halotolerans]